MAVVLSPLGVGWQFFGGATANSSPNIPLANGSLAVYQAGTSTPVTTYTSSTGGTPNAWPIVLDSTGRVPHEIWWAQGASYKAVLYDGPTTGSNVISTWDNIPGINDPLSIATSSSSYTGFRNRIINGAMRVCQRIIPSNGTVSLSTGAWNYGGVDRFMTSCIGPGSYSTGMDVSTVPAGLPGHAGYQSALRIIGAASNNNPGIQQRIEQRNSVDLVSQQVVVSCYVYQNTGSTMTASMNLNRATNGPDDFSLEAADNAVTMTTSSVPSGAWTRVSGYVTPSTSATLGMEFRILLTGNLGAGTTVWFDLFQVELNAASTSPTTFEEKPQGFELEQCLRYLFAANGNTTSINSPVGMGQCFSTTQSHIYITFPVPLRIAPTTVTVNSASNFELFDASGTGHTSNGISLSNQATVNGAVLNATLSSALLVAGNATELDFLNITAGQLLFSAEL